MKECFSFSIIANLGHQCCSEPSTVVIARGHILNHSRTRIVSVNTPAPERHLPLLYAYSSHQSHLPVAEPMMDASSLGSSPSLGAFVCLVAVQLVIAWTLLDAEVHSLWGTDHGDGQQQVVADLDSTTSAHSTTMGDLSKHDNIECRILDVGNLGAHVLQEHLCHSKSLFWLCTNLKYAFSCFDKSWTTCQSMKNTMNVRVPAAAALIPPETGASTNWTEETTCTLK